jgi:hypothetical protein
MYVCMYVYTYIYSDLACATHALRVVVERDVHHRPPEEGATGALRSAAAAHAMASIPEDIAANAHPQPPAGAHLLFWCIAGANV